MNTDLDSRLIEGEHLEGLRDQITCLICCQILTEDKKPVECNKCQNQLFCTQCIDQWRYKNRQCPCCR